MTDTGFTIAIPTHNRRETVVLAALSALRQTRPPLEVIVLCDGCTDGTAEAVRALDTRVEALELPKGPGYAYDHRNRALERARGEVILWLGDDDLLLPDHLERIGEYWDAGVFDVVTTPAALVRPDDSMWLVGQDWNVPWHREAMTRTNTNVMASVSVGVDLAREVGGWDGSQPRWGDWDLWQRVLASGARAAMTNEPTVLHFRATGREQPWVERVRQNTNWLDEISDTDRLPAVRRTLARLASERDAYHLGKIATYESTLSQITSGRWWRLRGRLLSLMPRSGLSEHAEHRGGRDESVPPDPASCDAGRLSLWMSRWPSLTGARRRFGRLQRTTDAPWAHRPEVADVGRDWLESSYYEEAEAYIEGQWAEIVWPMISDANFDVVVDLAAGHGRNSIRLAPLSRRLYVIDIHASNLDACRRRLAGVEHATFLECDGRTLPLEAETVTLVYCFDAMVHFDSDVVRSYLSETRRVLRPGGRGFFHHSNFASNPAGDFHDNPGWRNFMTAELFEHYAGKVGLRTVHSRVLDWDAPRSDCVTLVERPA